MTVMDRGGGAPLHVTKTLSKAHVASVAAAAQTAAFNIGSNITHGWDKFMSLAALKSRPGYLKGDRLDICFSFK